MHYSGKLFYFPFLFYFTAAVSACHYDRLYCLALAAYLMFSRQARCTEPRNTLGDRAFSVTAARARNALPSTVRSAPSLLQFRRDLKTALHVSVIVLFTIVFGCVTDCNCNL